MSSFAIPRKKACARPVKQATNLASTVLPASLLKKPQGLDETGTNYSKKARFTRRAVQTLTGPENPSFCSQLRSAGTLGGEEHEIWCLVLAPPLLDVCCLDSKHSSVSKDGWLNREVIEIKIGHVEGDLTANLLTGGNGCVEAPFGVNKNGDTVLVGV